MLRMMLQTTPTDLWNAVVVLCETRKKFSFAMLEDNHVGIHSKILENCCI
jgi:hypothetical protein